MRSLKSLLLTYELAFLFLVMVTSGLSGIWAYRWQQISVESVRLTGLLATAQRIRSDLFRQIKEVTLARLMEEPQALDLYAEYSRQIDRRFNMLRRRTASREDELAIQAMQRAYRVIQQDMNKIFTNPYLINRVVRLRILDPRYEQELVGEFEQAFQIFEALLAKQQRELEETVERSTQGLLVLLPILIVLAMALLVLSRLSLQRGFVRPMATVMLGARRISEGQLDHKIPVQGTEEMANLAQAINRMAIELARQRDALVESEKQAALGALMPVVAHNIRNPLASIRATAQLLDHADHPEEFREIKQAVVDTVDRLGRWVSALLSYLNPLKPYRITAPISSIVSNALRLLQPKLEAKGIHVVQADCAEEPEVSVDVDLMEQALYGLLLNAVDASPSGGRLTIAVKQGADHYTLSIEDQGPGLPFQPMPGSLSPGPSTKRFGTGLGIPFAFKVCNAHGWKLTFNPGEGGGARVAMDIPVVSAESAS
ncbi:MAG TPA: ATP-binding protein [Gammaproteobacteria bacterium]|nr:ATP-binding protein [Gammaproteobacteria bacterium]